MSGLSLSHCVTLGKSLPLSGAARLNSLTPKGMSQMTSVALSDPNVQRLYALKVKLCAWHAATQITTLRAKDYTVFAEQKCNWLSKKGERGGGGRWGPQSREQMWVLMAT